MMLYLSVVWLALHSTYALRWNSSGSGVKFEKIISLKMTSTSPQIDVYHEEEIIIKRDIQSYLNKIIIYCLISGYNEKSDIVYYFCKDEQCQLMHKDGESQTDEAYGMSVKTETNLPGQKGMKIHLSLKSDRTDITGNYYCNVKDVFGHFAIRSNYIQIRDIIFWEQNIIRNENNIKTTDQKDIKLSDLPITFPCTNKGLDINPLKPEWISQEFTSPVLWSICPVKDKFETLQEGDKMTFSKCRRYTIEVWPHIDTSIKPKDIKEMINWKYYVNSDGELNLFHFDETYNRKSESYALMCYRIDGNRMKVINTYIKMYNDDEITNGVTFNATQTTYNKKLTAISPQLQHVNIYARKIVPQTKESDIPAVAIYAKYSAGPNAVHKWLYNGDQLNNRVDLLADRYKVNFVGDITSGQAGNYTLVVSDDDQRISMSFLVTILGPPVLLDPNCLPKIQYVWELDDITLNCTYKDKPTELNIKINDIMMRLDSNFQPTSVKLLKNYPYLTELNFTVNPTNYITSDSVTMSYKATKLRKTQGQLFYQDHTISFFANNKLGLSLKSTSIFVVPKVKFQIEEFPDLINCTSFCSSSERHEFRCRLKTIEYKGKELTIDHYWTINGHRLDKKDKLDNFFAPYFVMDPDTKDLILLPVNSTDTVRDNFVKDALKSNFIICHIDLFSSDTSVSKFAYYSSNDVEVRDRLRSKITLDSGTTYVAYVAWIVVTIVILVLAVVAVVLICRRLKEKGEVYQLGKLDRKWGHDTEKELEEEIFHPYKYDNTEMDIHSLNSSHNSADNPTDNQT